MLRPEEESVCSVEACTFTIETVTVAIVCNLDPERSLFTEEGFCPRHGIGLMAGGGGEGWQRADENLAGFIHHSFPHTSDDLTLALPLLSAPYRACHTHTTHTSGEGTFQLVEINKHDSHLQGREPEKEHLPGGDLFPVLVGNTLLAGIMPRVVCPPWI